MDSPTAGVDEQLERRDLMLAVGLAGAVHIRRPCPSDR